MPPGLRDFREPAAMGGRDVYLTAAAAGGGDVGPVSFRTRTATSSPTQFTGMGTRRPAAASNAAELYGTTSPSRTFPGLTATAVGETYYEQQEMGSGRFVTGGYEYGGDHINNHRRPSGSTGEDERWVPHISALLA